MRYNKAMIEATKVHVLIERYIEIILPRKPKSINTQLPQLHWWKAQLGHYEVNCLKHTDIIYLRDKLAVSLNSKGVIYSPSTVNRYLAVLSHVFTVAYEDWGLISESPFKRIKILKEPRGRTRYLLDHERSTLLGIIKKSNHKYLYTIVCLLLSTGARRGEVLGITWSCVDFERKFIVIKDTKNGDSRSLPLSEHNITLLKQLHNTQCKDHEYVFKSKYNENKPANIREAWDNCLRRSGIRNFRMHDLRHSCASYLAMNGASMIDIASILGHRTLDMAKRYTHLSNKHISNIVLSMNENLFN